QQCRRVRHAGLQPVIGRVGVEDGEFFLALGGDSVVRCIEPAGGELLVAQQVEYGDVRYRDGEQLRPLGEQRADQQATVRVAVDRQPIVARPAGRDQLLGNRDRVVEHVLLVRQPAGVVPGRAVLAAATQIGDYPDAAGLSEGD